ncbi:integrator complex subunit 10, partial [Caerostris extrusa]
DEKKKVPVKRKRKRRNIEPEIQPTKEGSMRGASNYPEKPSGNLGPETPLAKESHKIKKVPVKSKTKRGNIGPELQPAKQRNICMSKSTPPEDSSKIISSFLKAVDFYELLDNDYMFARFRDICNNIKLKSWPIFEEFYMNFLYCKGNYYQILSILENKEESSNDLHDIIKNKLQMANCHFMLKNFKLGLENLLDAISNLPMFNSSTLVEEDMQMLRSMMSKYDERTLYFLNCDSKEVFPYCISVLLKLFKFRQNIIDTQLDMSLGFMLVLMQYDLENEYDTLSMIIEKIKIKKTFVFKIFFDYIVHAIILEEVHQLTKDGSIDFRFMPDVLIKRKSMKVIMSRKYCKEELNELFIKQMRRAAENRENLLIDFIKKERKNIILTLSPIF